ncbi:MAG: T9SS type A sorting domain-containing protein, partial [Ignavibacteriae bacterium]|nr:T9SS type A sorting domain-containing protein [Ignavibacteriota bacterium]
EIPSDYKLFQNYPNPFNPVTKIRFQIKESGFVTLKVYNILGREISTLINENLRPGIYEVPFSVNQFSNNQISSGIYFYKISSGDFHELKKMVILK